MTRIKICGLTNVDDALAAVEAGADLLGFVLAESPRQVTVRQARAIYSQVPNSIMPVLVLRDQPLNDLVRTAEQAGYCLIQLHGNEPPEHAKAIRNPILRRITVCAGDTSATLTEQMKLWPAPSYLLDPGAGSGRIFEWSIARGLVGRVFLAGGLTPENVGEAIRLARPYGVDVSSGVERSPGRKDPNRIAEFVQAVREADDLNDA